MKLLKRLIESIKWDIINPSGIIPDSAISGRNYVCKEISKQFQYKPEKKDYWKTAKEFEKDKAGDCEDFALYFLAIIKRYYKIKGKLYISQETKTKKGHASALVDHKIYEPINGRVYTKKYHEKLGYKKKIVIPYCFLWLVIFLKSKNKRIKKCKIK